jgi:hypothetical protein
MSNVVIIDFMVLSVFIIDFVDLHFSIAYSDTSLK